MRLSDTCLFKRETILDLGYGVLSAKGTVMWQLHVDEIEDVSRGEETMTS